jgi:hypothetical protein
MLLTLSMETYYRSRWTYALEMIFTCMAHTYFAILFMPSKANSMFPFAFKTAAMEAQERWNAERQTLSSGNNKSPGAIGSRPRPRDSELVETSYGLSSVQGAIGGSSGMRQRNTSRQTVSGGLQLDAPATRVRNLATSLRKKLGVVYQVADQLEEELELLDVDGDEEHGADLVHTDGP